MINKPQILGKNLNVYSVSFNDNSPGSESDILAISTQIVDKTREIKAIKPIVLRSWLLSSLSVDSNTSIQTNSCTTYIESTSDFSLTFLRNSQIAYVKNSNNYGEPQSLRNRITVSFYKSDNSLVTSLILFPKESVVISLDKDNNLKVKSNTITPYPVGSIYYSFDNTNPANIYPGTTWELQPANCFVWTSGLYTKTLAGEATHVLTYSEIPDHIHSFSHYHNWTQFRDNGNPDTWDRGSGNTSRRFLYRSQTQRSEPNRRYYDLWTSTATTTTNMNLSYTGSSSAHENTPQYYKAYCWKRLT